MKHYLNRQALIKEIYNKVGKPVNQQVVLATVESIGIRAKDVQEDFGCLTITELASLTYNELDSWVEPLHTKHGRPYTKKKIGLADYPYLQLKFLGFYYPKGLLHILPVLIQLGSIVLFGYSLWTYIGFNHIQSTAVVLGVITGLTTTAGFVQVIGRQASFYWNYGDYYMVKKTILFIIKKGITTMLLVFLVLLSINMLFHLYPTAVLLVVCFYAVLIGGLLLFLAPLHTIKQPWVISIAIAAGTTAAILLKLHTNWGIYFTHAFGICAAILVAMSFQLLFFKFKISKQKNRLNYHIRPEVIFYHNYPYFLYGFFLYLFIFSDRLLAWSTSTAQPLPLVVYFEKNYELGMDMAILMFLLLTGVLEYSIASFTRFLDIGQQLYAYSNHRLFNKKILQMYWQNIGLLLITAIGIGLVIYYLIAASWGYKSYFHEDFVSVSSKICLIGASSYLLLAWGMLNTLYLFTLGKVMPSLKGIIMACMLNFFIGFFCSRFIGYQYSVIGLLFGSFFFMVFTLCACLTFLKNLDFNYYAAY